MLLPHATGSRSALGKAPVPPWPMIAISTLFVAMSQKSYLIIWRVEIAAGELATPPEAFIAKPPRSPSHPGSVEWQQQQKAALRG